MAIVVGALLVALIAEFVGSRAGANFDRLRVVAVFSLVVAAGAAYRMALQTKFDDSAAKIRAHYEENFVRSKDMFIANVSHGIRTPLTGVVGFAHLLKDTGSGSGNDEAIDMILGESAELSRMVDDLVTAAHLDAGALTVNIEAVSIVEEAERVRDFMDLVGARISLDIHDVDVMVDKELFAQVLRNLVANAHRHGKTSITIRGQLTEGRYVCHVVDQGPGVPPGDHSRLFSRFSSSSFGGQFAGSMGLGLSVAAELTARMGGEISYRRIRGETHFVLSLPVAEGQTEPATRVVRGPDERRGAAPIQAGSSIRS